MVNGYLATILKRNWKSLLILIIIIIIASIIINKVSTMSYKNQHVMHSTYPLEFTYKGKEVQGFVHLSYWVKTKPKNIENLSSSELDDYLYQHGYINLADHRQALVSTLKSYSLESIRQNWKDDYQYFKKNDIYFINNDSRLMDTIKEQEININLKYEFKKIFFVYLDEGQFSEFVKNKQ